MLVKPLIQTLAISACILMAGHDLALAIKANAQRFKYVTDAVNQINYLQYKSLSTKDNAREIVDQGCKMLTQLVSDEQFSTIVRKTVSGRMSAEQRELFTNLSKINDVMDQEMVAFQNTGISQLTSIQALAAAIPYAKTFDPEKINADGILKDIQTLQQKTCSLDGVIDDTEKWAKRKSAIVLGVSGVAFVLANGSA